MKYTLAALAGAVIGAVGAIIFSRYEEQKANTITFEEIKAEAEPKPEESKQDEQPKTAKADAHLEEKKDILEISKELAEEPPVNYTKPRKKRPKKPFVISPEELGDLEDYQTITLNYFADGTLTDEDYKVVEDLDDLIGPEALTHFGEYEEDSVCVRNEKYKCDFEILNDLREYDEVLKENPYLSEE